jgi:hypothetical protein
LRREIQRVHPLSDPGENSRSFRGTAMLNNFLLFLVSVFGIVVLDDDPTGVSPQEWIFFAVMLYAAVSFFRRYQERIDKGE